MSKIQSTCVDGIISTGKSTVISSFKKTHPECYYIEEPLNQFTHFKTHSGTNISPLYMTYDDSQNSTAFQLYVLEVFDNTLKKVYEDCLRKNVKIVFDRCIISAHIFTRTLQKRGFIPSFAWKYWLKKFHEVKDSHFFHYPSKYIS